MLKKIFLIFVLLLSGIFIFGYFLYQKTTPPKSKVRYILSPTIGRPRIVQQGKIFPVIFRAPYEVVFNSATVISRTYSKKIQYSLKIEQVEYNSADNIWIVNIRVPGFVSEDIYDLYLFFSRPNGTSGNVDYQPNALKVVEKINDSFKFVIISDLDFSTKQGLGFIRDEKEKYAEELSELNLLNPEFILCLGGLVNNSFLGYTKAYKEVYSLLVNKLNVPIFLVPGNEDYRITSFMNIEFNNGSMLWQSFFGNSTYSFDYGKFHFIALNTYESEPEKRTFSPFSQNNSAGEGKLFVPSLNWLKNDIELAKAKDLKTIVFCHHNPARWLDIFQDSYTKSFSEIGRKEFLNILIANKVKYVFAGHSFKNSVENMEGTTFVNTASISPLCKFPKCQTYRLVTVEKNEIKDYNYIMPPNAYPFSKLKYNFKHSNDGTQNKNIIVVSNELRTDINGLSIIAKMAIPPKGKSYVVKSNDEEKTENKKIIFRDEQILSIRVDVEKNSRKVLEITTEKR